MGFDIAIFNGHSDDGYKVINSVKAAYLYADEVRVYDHIIPFGFNVDDIKVLNEDEMTLSKKYRVYDPYYLSVFEVEADGRERWISDYNSDEYKEFLFLHRKCINRIEDRAYVRECERLEFLRKNINSLYSSQRYQKEMRSLGVKLITPAKESQPDHHSLFGLSLKLYKIFIGDKGFKILNQELDKPEMIVPSVWTPPALAEYTISSLPGFEEASFDEIKDIRKELDKYIVPYRAAVLRMAESIKSIPYTKDFQQECMSLYYREVEPKVASINEAIRDNNIFLNITKKIITNTETWASLGALATAIATTGELVNAISVGAATAFGGISLTEGILSTLEEKKKIKDNEMYFLYEAGKKLAK